MFSHRQDFPALAIQSKSSWDGVSNLIKARIWVISTAKLPWRHLILSRAGNRWWHIQFQAGQCPRPHKVKVLCGRYCCPDASLLLSHPGSSKEPQGHCSQVQ